MKDMLYPALVASMVGIDFQTKKQAAAVWFMVMHHIDHLRRYLGIGK